MNSRSLMGALLVGAALLAAPAYADPSALDLMRSYDRIMGPENFDAVTRMVAHRDDGTVRSYKMAVLKKGDDKFRIAFQEPAAVVGQELLRQGDNLWVYMPNLKRAVRLANRDSFQGGDFNNADVLRVKYEADYTGTVSADGDAWVIEGVADPITFGMNACAGLAPEQMTSWCRFEDIRAGGYDPAARLAEMDADKVDAEVLFPTPRLSQAIIASGDVEYHHAMVRAYNEWLAEFCGYAPERFGGMAIVPNRGVEPAVAEVERALASPGIRGVVMGCYPNGTLAIQPEDDKLFGMLAERGVPLAIHVSLTQGMPAAHRAKLPGYGRFFDAPNRMVEMVFAGVFDRFPELQVFFAETDFGWVPYVKEQVDNNYQRLESSKTANPELETLVKIKRAFPDFPLDAIAE